MTEELEAELLNPGTWNGTEYSKEAVMRIATKNKFKGKPIKNRDGEKIGVIKETQLKNHPQIDPSIQARIELDKDSIDGHGTQSLFGIGVNIENDKIQDITLLD